MEEYFSYIINAIIPICASLKTFFVDNFSQLIGVIGASAWSAPWVYQRCSRPTIKGQIISYYANKGEFNNKKCRFYFMALNIVSLKKESNIDATKTHISIKYKGDENIYYCEQYSAGVNKWVDPKGLCVDLKIFHEQTLLFTSSLPKNTATKIYVLFKEGVDDKSREVEKISITLFDYSNYKNKLTFNYDDIDHEKIVWDDRIWVHK